MARYYDFAGRKVILPGPYTQRNFPAEDGAGSIIGEVIIMGEASKGGIPYNAYDEVEDVINVVEGQAQALSVFGGGDLYYGAEFFLTPTKDARFKKPSQAKCIVVNQMAQADTELLASAASIIDVAWNKFGTDGNTSAIKISSGSTTGKLVEVIYKGEDVIKQDNVTLALMKILYTGAGSPATMTITATKLTTACTGATDDNLDITLADFTSLGSLINYINTQENYTCTLTGQSDEITTVFDAVTTEDITSEYTCVGITEAIIRLLNSTDEMTATLHAAAARTVIDDMSEFQYFTGGTVSAATTDDWEAALLKLEDYDLNNIVAMSGSHTIHLLVQDHVDRMNDMEIKKYRQTGAGAGSGATAKATRITEMKALNSAYFEYCVSPFKRYDYVNKEVPSTDFYPYYLYAMIAGLRYANNVGMDVVFKYLNVISTPEISTQDQKDYAAAGATFIQRTVNVTAGNQFEIKVNNTTYQGSQVTRTNPSVVYAINVLTKDYEEQIIEQIRSLDTVANSVIIAKIQNWITTYLFPKYRDDYKWITDSVDGIQKAFSGVVFSQNGEQFNTTAILTMSVTPRFAFNFFTFIVPGQNV
ncbi:MAG: hypothetical protein WC401_09790 [Bacteroidales bacterium]|jgi:hypothetical protein